VVGRKNLALSLLYFASKIPESIPWMSMVYIINEQLINQNWKTQLLDVVDNDEEISGLLNPYR
jgi:hypothetical protein